MMPMESSSICSRALASARSRAWSRSSSNSTFFNSSKASASAALASSSCSPQVVDRALQVFFALVRGLGIGRIGEMRRVLDAGTVLLDLDLALELDGHPFELGNHGFDLHGPAALLVHLEFPQADQRLTRLHRHILPEAPTGNDAARKACTPRPTQPVGLIVERPIVIFVFPNRRELSQAADIPQPTWLPRPCAGPGSPPMADAGGSPRPLRRWSRADRRRAGSVPPCRHRSPSPAWRG